MKKQLFTALLLAAAPAVWADAPLACRDIPTEDAVHQKQECVFQGSDMNAAYQAFRQHDADNKAWLPKKMPTKNRTQKWQSTTCDDEGMRDTTIEKHQVSKNALYMEYDSDGLCASPYKAQFRMQQQGKQIKIQFDRYES